MKEALCRVGDGQKAGKVRGLMTIDREDCDTLLVLYKELFSPEFVYCTCSAVPFAGGGVVCSSHPHVSLDTFSQYYCPDAYFWLHTRALSSS